MKPWEDYTEATEFMKNLSTKENILQTMAMHDVFCGGAKVLENELRYSLLTHLHGGQGTNARLLLLQIISLGPALGYFSKVPCRQNIDIDNN
jgi:hypothetical protein